MKTSAEQGFLDIISGRRRGAAAAGLRAVLAVGEPLYAAATHIRNFCYDNGIFASDPAPKPVVCVGNLTTGGTGKTPVVRWLADRLRGAGLRPAVLQRGYKGDTSAGGSDEQRLLASLLNAAGALRTIPVVANPSRLEGAQQALKIDPHIDVFLLDDGFQHRRLRRNFDLVLIDATNPFGYGHQLPRGLLRESPRGLRRAHALLITHSEVVENEVLSQVEQKLRQYNAWAPRYRCRHVHRAAIDLGGRKLPLELTGKRYFIFCGIGNPQAFERQLRRSAGGDCVGTRFFGDHHAYTAADLEALSDAARRAHADVLLTTEKDGVKLQHVAEAAHTSIPIWRVQLDVQFADEDGERLLEQILSQLPIASGATASGAASAPGGINGA